MMRKAAFLDRDGVINIDHAYVHKIEEFDWVPGVLEAARALSEAGYLLVVVTNQSGIGRGYYDEAAFTRLTDWMKARFAEAGAPSQASTSVHTIPKRRIRPTAWTATAGSPVPACFSRLPRTSASTFRPRSCSATSRAT